VKWTIATVFPFLAHSQTHIFLKPEVTQAAAKRRGFSLNYKPELNWLTYSCLLSAFKFFKPPFLISSDGSKTVDFQNRNRAIATMTPPTISVIEGDLLDQDVEVIVNAWNQNIIPWWLLLPQGVSGAIKRRGGTVPFKEVAKYGSIPLGGAVLTSAGNLPFKGIIHVAGINMLWRASEWSIRKSVRNAVRLAHEKRFTSMAFPLIGAGSGSFNQDQAKTIMLDELGEIDVPMNVKVVVFRAACSARR
jgi:O-acetyl-ADP-ribose deacetylase (regulator of RNase III)